MEVFSSIDISYKGAICLWTKYKLRSGRDVYHKRYFDRRFRLLPGES